MQNDELLYLQNILSQTNNGNMEAIINIILERLLTKGEEDILYQTNLNELNLILNIENIDILDTKYIIIPYTTPELIKYFIDYIICLYNDFTKKICDIETSNIIVDIVTNYLKKYQICTLVDQICYFRIESLIDKLNIINDNYNLDINDIDNSNYKEIILRKKICNKKIVK